MYTSTYEGITLDPLYTASDTQDLRAARTFPGSYPLRGASAAGNLCRPWEIAQFCDETLPGDAHEGIVHELDRGASTVAFVLDGRTREGLDADSNTTEDSDVSVSSLGGALWLAKFLRRRLRSSCKKRSRWPARWKVRT